jgi:hypothetical protein
MIQHAVAVTVAMAALTHLLTLPHQLLQAQDRIRTAWKEREKNAEGQTAH